MHMRAFQYKEVRERTCSPKTLDLKAGAVVLVKTINPEL
jgi:hypothetical protein